MIVDINDGNDAVQVMQQAALNERANRTAERNTKGEHAMVRAQPALLHQVARRSP
jgi:hypothetical protein